MPEGSWLQTTDARSVTGDASGTGETATPTAAAAPQSRGQPRRLHARSQSEVARMMVRLRQMHRVTDVELNESAQEQAGGDASLQTAAARSTSST